MTISYSTNFTDSNKWVSDKLPNHTSIFQGCTLESINDEQEDFYISAVLAGVYGGSIRDEFVKEMINLLNNKLNNQSF